MEEKLKSFFACMRQVQPMKYDALSPGERRDLRIRYESHQKGMCWHCKAPLAGPPPDKITRRKINKKLFPPSFFDWPVHLHHDHETGMTLGAVHNYCNAVLWQYHGQ